MVKAFSRRIITDVTVRLGKVTVTMAGSNSTFGTFANTVLPFACRCCNRHSIAGNGKIGDINQSFGYADLQLLGLGRNGHIGFNEPDDHFEAGTHCVDLTEATIQANKRFFASEEDVPRKAISMGTGNIMSAKTILLVANGKNKAKALAAAIKGPVTPQCPASILQFHPNAIIVADEDALSLIREKGLL